MPDESNKDIYGMEPDSVPRADDDDRAAPAPGPSSSPRPGRPIEPAGSRTPDPLPLEDVDEIPPALRSVKELDVCPNCGATMRNSDDVVCLRCGFDLKTMKRVATATGVVEVARPGTIGDVDEDEPHVARKPIVVDGLGGTNAPLIAAGVAGAIMALAYMAGWDGVFGPVVINGEVVPGADIPLGDRFVGLLKFLVSVGMWTGCGLGALAFTAYLNGMRLGDMGLAAARMLGVVAVMHLATLMSFPSRPVEGTLEALAQAGIFAALSWVAFSLKPKDVPILVGGVVILFLLMWVSAWVIVWGTA